MSTLNKNEIRSLLQSAQDCEAAGQLAQAEQCYHQILEKDPSCDTAWHALGLLAFYSSQIALAIQYIEAAISHKPDVPLYYSNLCEMYRRQGQLVHAETAGLNACRLAPKSTDAHYNLGLVYSDRGDYAGARRFYELALKINPSHGLSWNNLGFALERLDERIAAIKAYEKALAINPHHVEARVNLGTILAAQGKADAAIACFETAIAVQPQCIEAHYHLSFLKYYRPGDAHLFLLEQLYAELDHHPLSTRIQLCFALGKALKDSGDDKRAFTAYEQGRRLQDHERRAAGAGEPASMQQAPLPDRTAERLHDEGIKLYKQNCFIEALACYDQALAIRPDYPEALNSKGFVLQDMGRPDEALSCLARSVELAPDMSIPRLNLGMLQLKLEQWEEGWKNYEARWTGSAEATKGSIQRPHCPLPFWDGKIKDTQDKRILILTEQGFGDTFQFSRYLPLLAERFIKVGFVCSPPTMRLMEWSFSDRLLLLSRMPTDFGAWDFQCPIMSLPHAFGTLPSTVPSSVPYLKTPLPAAMHWRECIESAAPGRLRIGIAWAGRKSHHFDTQRSLQFEQLSPLFADRRIAWFSLQKWMENESRPSIPDDLFWVDWTDELIDFADTAALVSGLDLVISVDSSMVHLAGALGRPVWMMNRFNGEWRWSHNRADSPWYPSLRIFNSTQFGQWQGVLEDIATAIQTLFDSPSDADMPVARTGT